MLASGSIHSWHIPGPNGPSRYTVGGTRSQPAARDTAYAATSRPASVPCGKSHSGRSPAIGLYTQADSVEPRGIVQYKVAFEGRITGPSISSSPSRSSSSASAWSSGICLGRRGGRGRESRRAGGFSAIGGPVAILARADVPLFVERQAAERARRPALSQDAQCPLGKGPRRGRGDTDPEHPGPVLGDVLGQRLHRGLR